MKKTTHTPGPWRTGAWTSHGMMIRGPKDEYIGYAQGYPKAEPAPYELSEPEAEANATLIAAAPDLLEALEAIIDSARDGRDIPEWLDERLVSAEAAIHKARGER